MNSFALCSLWILLASVLVVLMPLDAHAASGTIEVEGFYVDYDIEGGFVKEVFLDPDFVELIVSMESTSGGVLELTIPRALLDAKFEENDDIFFVIVDGFETDYLETATTEESRTLAIPFFSGDSKIEVIGTKSLDTALVSDNKQDVKIPQWIRSNAQWWSDGSIGDKDFLSGIQYLIDKGIMVVPASSSGVSGSAPFVPNWIKDTAGWWAEGRVTDSDFVNGIKWLVENGIITV